MIDSKQLASQIVQNWIKRVAAEEETSEEAATVEITIDALDHYVKLIEQRIAHAPIRGKESGVITWDKPKTAALCFDRVWTGQIDHIPEGIRFFNGSKDEMAVALVTTAVAAGAKLDQDMGLIDQKSRKILRNLISSIADAADAIKERVKPGEHAGDAITRILSESIQVPALYAQNRHCLPYEPGRHEVILSTINDLQVVDERAISWEQVIEFRKDHEARAKYRRLVHWLDKEMVGQTPDYIRDEIAIRLKLYESALRKHGITTVLGALSTVLEAKQLIAAAASGAFLGRGDPVVGLCVASGTLVAKAAIEITKSLLDLNETRLKAEIAFVHDVKKLG